MKMLMELVLFADDFPVETVAQEIGLPVIEIAEKGNIRLTGPEKTLPRIEETSSITFATEWIETIDLNVVIEKMYNLLAPKENIIRKCIDLYGLHAKFCAVVHLSENPILQMSKEFISLAANLHAQIEFDTYLDYDDNDRPILHAE